MLQILRYSWCCWHCDGMDSKNIYILLIKIFLRFFHRALREILFFFSFSFHFIFLFSCSLLSRSDRFTHILAARFGLCVIFASAAVAADVSPVVRVPLPLHSSQNVLFCLSVCLFGLTAIDCIFARARLCMFRHSFIIIIIIFCLFCYSCLLLFRSS